MPLYTYGCIIVKFLFSVCLHCVFLCLVLQLQPHPSYPNMVHLVETTSLQTEEGGETPQKEGGMCVRNL